MNTRKRWALLNWSYRVLRLISKKEAARAVGYHPEHLMRLVREGKFPRPVRPGSGAHGAVRFVESELEAWLTQRMQERDAA